MSVALPKTLELACLIIRNGTMTGPMATARSLIIVDAVEMTIALTQNQHVVKLAMLFHQLVSNFFICHFIDRFVVLYFLLILHFR